MAKRIDATMDRYEQATGDPVLDQALTHPRRRKLTMGDYSILPLRELPKRKRRSPPRGMRIKFWSYFIQNSMRTGTGRHETTLMRASACVVRV